MKLLTGLFRFARKRTQTTDNDMGMFREKLNELVEKKDGLKDEEIVKRVDELKEMTADLPDEDEKAKLDRFLEDFKAVKEQDGATAKEAATMVADLFEKLDTAAMKDVPDAAEEEVAEEVTEETVAPEGDETKDDDSLLGYMKKPDAPELKPGQLSTKDDDGNAEYTLEEIYQFVKKRMAEDCADGAEEEEELKEEEEVVTDHAPRVPVTMNGTAVKGSLGDMFSKIKEGGR